MLYQLCARVRVYGLLFYFFVIELRKKKNNLKPNDMTHLFFLFGYNLKS